MAITPNGATVSIASETLANSLGATGNVLTSILASAQINLASAGANTLNGNTFRIHVSGVTPPIVFGSENIVPPVTLAILVGANGNVIDQTVVTATIPALPSGAWSADAVLTCRKNATFSGGSNANTQWTGVIYNVSNPVPYSTPPEVIYANPSANGAVNVSLQTAAGAYTSNLANISVWAGLNTSQNGNTLVEQCHITLL